jgi:hypothetical protein
VTTHTHTLTHSHTQNTHTNHTLSETLTRRKGDGGGSETGKRSAERLPLFVAKTFFVPPKWTKVNKAPTNLCKSLRQTRF